MVALELCSEVQALNGTWENRSPMTVMKITILTSPWVRIFVCFKLASMNSNWWNTNGDPWQKHCFEAFWGVFKLFFGVVTWGGSLRSTFNLVLKKSCNFGVFYYFGKFFWWFLSIFKYFNPFIRNLRYKEWLLWFVSQNFVNPSELLNIYSAKFLEIFNDFCPFWNILIHF